MNINKTYLEKRLKVIVSSPLKLERGSNHVLVGTISKNISDLGYVFSPVLYQTLCEYNEEYLAVFYNDLVKTLKEMRGAHRPYNPMYPNFPKQVLEMSEFELYFNALVHYWSAFGEDIGVLDKAWLPKYEKDERLPLTEQVKYDVINLGNMKDFNSIFTSLIGAKSSISESDKEIVKDFISSYGDLICSLFPSEIPMKEQLALLVGTLLSNKLPCVKETYKYIKTPTDVLRIATVLSGGDVSLAENTKFKSFSRQWRKFLLLSLEKSSSSLGEDMVKYKEQWVRLGEKLHPGEYANKYPRLMEAFTSLRDNEKIVTFHTKVENNLLGNNIREAVALLSTRPGEFARRLDHILRNVNGKNQKVYANEFLKVAEKVSNPVLLQLYTHFRNRTKLGEFRSAFPKGNLGKIHVIESSLPPMDNDFCTQLSKKISNILVRKFSSKDSLKNVYLDENLKSFLVPFSQRSASKALKTIVRGSKIPLDGDYDTIRFFVWWKNGQSRTDIDLTATILDDNWNYKRDIAYYNLKDLGGHHSGDITSAPDGAAEFIDISLEKVLENGGRYIVMGLYSYTSQPYCDLPECFAGWMGRKNANSGEIFEAKTVKNKIDISSNTTVCLPLVIDTKERKVIWVDLGLKQRPMWNNARNNSHNIALICKAMANLNKPNLYDLFSIHIKARNGKLVTDPKDADTVFDTENTPYEVDKILTEFL